MPLELFWFWSRPNVLQIRLEVRLSLRWSSSLRDAYGNWFWRCNAVILWAFALISSAGLGLELGRLDFRGHPGGSLLAESQFDKTKIGAGDAASGRFRRQKPQPDPAPWSLFLAFQSPFNASGRRKGGEKGTFFCDLSMKTITNLNIAIQINTYIFSTLLKSWRKVS